MRASDIDHGAPEHLYQQLAEILRHQITSGHLQGKIPSAITLAADYGVAVLTARAAVMLLRDEGLVFGEPHVASAHRARAGFRCSTHHRIRGKCGHTVTRLALRLPRCCAVC